jgi:phosphoribosylaminoimidazolecarboxamide formyltransferase/IMP cyclohydrolase
MLAQDRDVHAIDAAKFTHAAGPAPDDAMLSDAGVRCIVHPGGSKRDQDTFDLCNARGVTCLVTGTRHFRH